MDCKVFIPKLFENNVVMMMLSTASPLTVHLVEHIACKPILDPMFSSVRFLNLMQSKAALRSGEYLASSPGPIFILKLAGQKNRAW